jgi:DNA oxidative demethylase
MQLKEGLFYFPSYFEREAQEILLSQVQEAINIAPFFIPTMPKSNKPFSVKMSNAGALGWVSDKQGYRYEDKHPQTGLEWGEIPPLALKAWQDLSVFSHNPQACLINFYAETAKMGLHQDRDEMDLSAPVVSISLGASALFRYGGEKRGDKTNSIWINSGDVLVFGGASRLMFHGIDRIKINSSTLLPHNQRINLTLRYVK